MSGAWVDTFESMVIRKMQNNAVRKFPKNFDNMAKRSFMEMDETYQQTQEDIVEQANSEEFADENVFETTATVVEESKE